MTEPKSQPEQSEQQAQPSPSGLSGKHNHAESMDSAAALMSMSKEGIRVTVIGMIINVILTVVKVVVGFFGHSEALIADGIHSLSDLLSDIVVIVSLRISAKPGDKSHNYGHGKVETLASTVVGFMLLLAGIMIFYGGAVSIYQFLNGVPLESPTMLTFYAALASIIIKELLYQYTHRVAKKLDSTLIEVNAWHHRTDAFSSVGVAAGIGAAILLGGSWAVIDPIMAVILALYILYIAFKIIYTNVNDLAEASLGPEIHEDILQIVNGQNGVRDCHSLKTRKLGNTKAIDLHIMVDGDLSVEEADNIQTDIERCLKERFGPTTFVMIKVEKYLPDEAVLEEHKQSEL
ncbi:Manganese efflux system protein MneP [Methanosarcinaceae archaeon Ag5]|uniref:Manganese efflux system protein MneP n=1 Tax=Methanolapillus africanus TaxID=3028297 RepID=A0AAE4MIH0_9EURY|nr:Manganese efflux system protein MneP [Methanosarcinaceae archaeon Ag5]